MKRLYTILIGFMTTLVGFAFAGAFNVDMTPASQYALSGNILSFDITATNSSSSNVYLQQDLPNFVNYVNSNIIPDNLSSLTLGLTNDPYWTLSAGQTLNVDVEAVFQGRSFPTPTLDVIANIVDNTFVNVFTSATVILEPIADVTVSKVLVGSGPRLTGDTVTYNIEVKNVGSKIATGISLVDVWPASMLAFPNQAIVGGALQVPTIYNGQANNYLFTINDLAPYATSLIEIEGTLLEMFPAGQTFENTAFVLVESDQYTTTNDSTTLVSEVGGFADIVVNVFQTSPNPMFSGDEVGYLITYANAGYETGVNVQLDSTLSTNMVFGSSIPAPTNSLGNSAQWNLGVLSPGQVGEIVMTGIFLGYSNSGNEISNTVYAVTDSDEFYTNNNFSLVTGEMQAYTDMYVELYANNLTEPSRNFDTGTQIFAISGDNVELQIYVYNNGNTISTGIVDISNLIGFVNYSGVTSWNITVLPGGSQMLSINGIVGPQNFVSFTPLATLNYNGISNTDDVIIEEPYECGDGLLTQDEICEVVGQLGNIPAGQHCENIGGQCVLVDNLYIDLYANNLTEPSRNFDTGTQIFAISGDIVELMMVVENDGSDVESGVVNISNINGFVNYLGLTSWNVNIASGSSQTITLTGVVGPQNYISFTPIANLTYGVSLISDDVTIEEPLECGDGLITQGEMCDTNGQIGNMLPGQHCENVGGQCVIVTDTITNTVCMEYTSDVGTGQQCMSVTVDYEEEELGAQCRYLSAPHGVVIVDEDGEGDMDFTCVTEDGEIADEIRIDCGNGDEGVAYATSSFTYKCEYEYDENGDIDDNVYDVQCTVDDHTCDDCHRSARVDEGFYGVCGDGTIDDGEECDLGGDEDEEIDIDEYLDLDEEYDAGRYEDAGYYCEDCRIRQDDEFVYQAPQCLGTNTTISVMNNEYLPFRWRLRERDNLRVREDYDCENIDDDYDKTIIDEDSMQCTFVIYNHDGEVGELKDVDCFDWSDSDLFDYFEGDDYGIEFDKVSGRYAYSIDSLFDGDVEDFGEYKLVLEKVEYEYCNPEDGEWEEGRTYEGVCEVNFALTRPYLMQISTFGIQPVATDADFLEDFYDMKGNDLIDSSDIRDTMEVGEEDYDFDSDVVNQMDAFKTRYEPLALVVDNDFEIRDGKTIGDLFNNGEVKKVPNQLIFFVKGEGQMILKQLTEYFPGTPFTIYIEGMDVVVEGSVKTNGMIITDKKIYFEDDSTMSYCEEGGQIVQGIFVAQEGFDSDTRLRNQERDQERCPWGNLQVKGVLIGDNLENLMNNRRSHLNDWFLVNSSTENAILKERRNEIFEGAALLIEYNPDLWENLPPGAESFTQTLDVYRY